ncbi:MAG: hypothetical protein JJT78_10910 [Leptospira sp.]|nr:hypothetical protein [Leptospira sp.]
MKKYLYIFIPILILFLFSINCQKERREKILGKPVIGKDAQPASMEEIAPLTSNAIGARKELHKNGWKVIPSTEKSLKTAKESSTMTAKHAMAAVLLKKGERVTTYPKELKTAIQDVRNWGVEFEQSEEETRRRIRENSWNLARKEMVASGNFLNQSKDSFVLGYLMYFERTEEDFKELKNIPGGYYNDLKSDFSNIYKESAKIRKENSEKLTKSWKGAIENGLQVYKDSYYKSGERANSLLAVVDILGGYTMAMSEFFLKPVGTSLMSSGEILLWDGVILPVSTSSLFAGRTLASTGMTLFYTSKVGVKTISPTIEAGFLSSVALVSASATVPTVVGGESLRAFNQVTVVAGTESARAAGTIGAIGYKTGEMVVGMSYDFGKDSTVSALYGLKTGVVLGYTALTVIPTQLVLSAPDSVFFLAWDGPRLVVAKSKGNLKQWGNVPAGTIVDLEKAKKQGVEVEIVTDDPKVIKEVIEAQDKDLKEGGKFYDPFQDKKPKY